VVANCSLGCFTTGVVSVLLGNGNGTFQPAVSFGSGGFGAVSVSIFDVNGDGKPDLIVANATSSVVGVLLGNGDGTFKPVVTYGSGGTGADSIAVADVNSDGKVDLVVANRCDTTRNCEHGSVGVLLGNGDGTFQAAVTFGSGGAFAVSIAVADLNADDKPDLLALNLCSTHSGGRCFGNGTLGVLLNITRQLTSTSLASSLNPSIYGQKVTFTARVTTNGPQPPTGSVAFTWGGIYSIGFVTLNSSGVATLTKSRLNADSYPLTAMYRGDVNNLSSTSAVLNQLVLETTSAATITSSPNPSTVGQAVTFTAKITSPTVTPAGPVTFTAGKTVLGTAQLTGGKATFTASSLPAGSTVVTVTYNGDSNIAKSSASVRQTVQ